LIYSSSSKRFSKLPRGRFYKKGGQVQLRKENYPVPMERGVAPKNALCNTIYLLYAPWISLNYLMRLLTLMKQMKKRILLFYTI